MRPLLTFALVVVASLGLSANTVEYASTNSDIEHAARVFQDTVPPVPRPKLPKAPIRTTATEAQRNRAGVLIEHTRLGIPAPEPGDVQRRIDEQTRKADERKAAEQAALADRLERRRQRLEKLRGEAYDDTNFDKRKLARRSRDARKREKALAKREAERVVREAERAELMAKREAERLVREAENAELLVRQAKERAEKMERQRIEAERAVVAAAERAERERREATRRAERTPPPVAAAPRPVATPKLTPLDKARLKQLRTEAFAMQRIEAARRKKAARAARFAYRAAKGERQAARRQAARDAAAARMVQRRMRKEALAQRRAGKAEKRRQRLAIRAQQKADRAQRGAARALAKAERRAANRLRKAARMAARNNRNADRLAARAARKADRDLRRAGRLAARAARRADRMARRAIRRADRYARRAIRRAARMARREARRLRRAKNPPYWTAEPAIAIGLPARSGGSSDEKSLEAITIQALAGYHWAAKGLSVRAGLAASVINSKVSDKSTQTETITRTGVVQIIQNPDGSRTEIMGPIQVPQTTTTEVRYYNRLNSIDFPLLVGYRIKGNRYGLLVEGGPSFNLSSGGEAHVREGEGFRSVSGGHFLGRRPGIGFLMMATGEYKLSEQSAITAGLRLQSFGGAFEDPEISSNGTRVSTLSLVVGYRVRF
ncbi:hypothetical protein [Neolewinella antarctica]|uniref:Outer membrane protein beta-barrel domain-containing protein n=1 Tax=Neolewinella antarctica TaxID=442734 RepID=A0ABX0XFV5_9BACT|nr:hypothetical protein [Neolewinella antarctica]NJC27764.1 hypothetical protein [Neolewinella antarctica]